MLILTQTKKLILFQVAAHQQLQLQQQLQLGTQSSCSNLNKAIIAVRKNKNEGAGVNREEKKGEHFIKQGKTTLYGLKIQKIGLCLARHFS